MAFRAFQGQPQGVRLLQRSLERGRLAHGYLFNGYRLDELEEVARTLAKTLNCLHPVRSQAGGAIDCCDSPRETIHSARSTSGTILLR